MFGDLARQSDAPPETLPNSIVDPTVFTDTPAQTQPQQASAVPQQPLAAPKQASAEPSVPRQSTNDVKSAEQSAPLPPFTRPPSPTLSDKAGGNQYLREAAALIPNVQMTDAKIVRGSQPSGQVLSVLKSAGVTTIINLRNEDVLVAQEEHPPLQQRPVQLLERRRIQGLRQVDPADLGADDRCRRFD